MYGTTLTFALIAFGETEEGWSILESKAVVALREAIRSPSTREAYERRLVQFFRDVGFSADDFVAKARKNVAWAQKIITDCVLKQKQRVVDKEIEASGLANIRKPLPRSTLASTKFLKISSFNSVM